jgi:hypothetical protein
MAEPFHRFRQAERDIIQRHLEELNLAQWVKPAPSA